MCYSKEKSAKTYSCSSRTTTSPLAVRHSHSFQCRTCHGRRPLYGYYPTARHMCSGRTACSAPLISTSPRWSRFCRSGWPFSPRSKVPYLCVCVCLRVFACVYMCLRVFACVCVYTEKNHDWTELASKTDSNTPARYLKIRQKDESGV